MRNPSNSLRGSILSSWLIAVYLRKHVVYLILPLVGAKGSWGRASFDWHAVYLHIYLGPGAPTGDNVATALSDLLGVKVMAV